MYKTLFSSLLTGTMAVLLLSACTEDKQEIQESKDTGSTAVSSIKISKPEQKPSKNESNDDNQVKTVMDEPVNFSTPEDVEQTLLRIRQEQGDQAFKKLNSAMSYMMFYDLSIGRNKEKLYAKLDGKTPNEIIAEGKK